MALKFLSETFMPANGRRGAFKTVEFQDRTFAPHEIRGITRRQNTDLLVVSALKSSIAVSVDIPVENHYRDTASVNTVDYRCYGISLVGGDYDDIEPIISKIPDVGNLLRVAVFGGTYFDRSLGMNKDLPLHLFVHLVAPVVVAALRHAYAVFLLLLATGYKNQSCGQYNTYDINQCQSRFHGISVNLKGTHLPNPKLIKYCHTSKSVTICRHAKLQKNVHRQ